MLARGSMARNVTVQVLSELGVLHTSPVVLPPAGPVGQTHLFSAHTPVWAFEDPLFARPFADPATGPLYETLPAGTTLAEALEHSALVVFLGAARTPQLEAALARRDAAVFVLEPEEARLEAFLSGFKPKALAERGVTFLLGRIPALVPPLARLLPERLFNRGCPNFFALEGLTAAQPQWCAEAVEHFEFLCYRHRIYPVTGQFNNRGLPLRTITRGLFYDQQLHLYENAADAVSQGNLRQIRGAFRGAPAVLVAAGPDLPERAAFLRQARDQALVIAVNNALKPLLALGVEPHFTVVNDNSVLTRESFAGLPALPRTILAAHGFSHTGGAVFPKKFFFGGYKPEIFGARPTLPIYGSVITAAFALARFLGCATCLLAGVQLASEDPWSLGYAKGSIHERERSAERPLIGRHPQLYPVATPSGKTLYTTLNFRDAALWFLDEIRASGLRCVNLTRDSILFGPGVEYEPDPALPPRPSVERTFQEVLALPAPRVDKAKVRAFLQRERQAWANTAGPLDLLLQVTGPEFLRNAEDALKQLDRGNVTYLVQRFADFDNRRFHELVFESQDPACRDQGLRSYLEYVRRMAGEFVGIIDGQLRLLD